MRTAIRGTGKLLISVGVLLLLFVAYQLWGTGLHTARAQDRLRDDFETMLAEAERQAGEDADVPVEPIDSPTSTAPELPAPEAPETDPLEPDVIIQGPTQPGGDEPLLPGEEVEPVADVELAVRWGDPIGRIEIDAIDIDFIYVEGVDPDELTTGPGHFPGTPYPGQAGNAALAGHRVTFMAPFNRIDELAPGDLVRITTAQGNFTYEVTAQPDGNASYIVSPDDTWILDDQGDNRLTLMACHPKYSAAQRIVVDTVLVGNPAETTAPSTPADHHELPDLGEAAFGADQLLAAGDPAARLPAALWSLAALGVWFFAWLIGRLWRKARWPAYVLLAPAFFVLLFQAFEQINRALPAAY